MIKVLPMPKTYRFIKRDLQRQMNWRRFMKSFKAFRTRVPYSFFNENGFFVN